MKNLYRKLRAKHLSSEDIWKEFIMENKISWVRYACGKDILVIITSEHDMLIATRSKNWEMGFVGLRPEIKERYNLSNLKFFSVAIDDNDNIVCAINESSAFLYSTNGFNWSFVPVDIESDVCHEFTSVAYGNRGFVALTLNSNLVWYSKNGLEWTSETIPDCPEIPEFQDIAFTANTYVAINADSNKCYLLKDDKWETVHMPMYEDWAYIRRIKEYDLTDGWVRIVGHTTNNVFNFNVLTREWEHTEWPESISDYVGKGYIIMHRVIYGLSVFISLYLFITLIHTLFTL